MSFTVWRDSYSSNYVLAMLTCTTVAPGGAASEIGASLC